MGKRATHAAYVWAGGFFMGPIGSEFEASHMCLAALLGFWGVRLYAVGIGDYFVWRTGMAGGCCFWARDVANRC